MAASGAHHGIGSLDAADWVVIGAYFLLLVLTGWWLSKRQRGTEDYFLAGRKMPVWAVSVSVLATALSAATFLGAPQSAFDGDLTYLSANIGVILAALIAAKWFIPAFYRHNVTTVYELLERRFGPGAKLAGSGMFMVGRVFANGARLYIAANAVSFVAFGDLLPDHILIAVSVMTVVGVLYTISGGIETVIWTDVVQTLVLIGATIAAAMVLWFKLPVSGGEIVGALGEAGKLKLLETGFSLDQPFTLWTVVTGVLLLNLGACATDHDLVQRMLTCRSAAKGSRSVIVGALMSIPVVILFMLIGHLLWVYYARPDLMGAAAPQSAPTDSRKVFLSFIVAEMPPGMSGLMIAGLFAIALGSLDSAINAMSATFVNDFYKMLGPARDEKHYLAVGRAGVLVWGFALGGFASACVWWQEWALTQGVKWSFIDLALSVMAFAYSGLVGTFVAALFTRRGTVASVIAALIAGFSVILILRPEVLPLIWDIVDERQNAPVIAWPWAMTAGAVVSFTVCIIPPSKPGSTVR